MKNIYVYDWFNPTSESERWLGCGNIPVVPPEWIRDIAVDIAVKFRGVTYNTWTSVDYIGGIKACGNAFCVFRVFNGGRDFRGRPNRWIMLAVEMPRELGIATNVFEALECEVFRAYAKNGVPAKARVPVHEPVWNTKFLQETDTWLPEKENLSGASARKKAEDYSQTLTSGRLMDGVLWVENLREDLRVQVESKLVRKPKAADADAVSNIPVSASPFSSARVENSLGERDVSEEALRRSGGEFAALKKPLVFVGVLILILVALWIRSQHFRRPMETHCDERDIHIYVSDFDTSYLKKEDGNRFFCPECDGRHEWHLPSNSGKYLHFEFDKLLEAKRTFERRFAPKKGDTSEKQQKSEHGSPKQEKSDSQQVTKNRIRD